MATVAQHQEYADRYLEIAAAESRLRNYSRSALALERALAHSAAALGTHWNYFPQPTRRQIGHILYLLAIKRHISHTSARAIHKFPDLHHTMHRARTPDDIAAARRTLRNTHRRIARIIAASNRAIATDHDAIPCPYWEIREEQ